MGSFHSGPVIGATGKLKAVLPFGHRYGLRAGERGKENAFIDKA